MPAYNYKFELHVAEMKREVHPAYKELKKTQSKDNRGMFFRTSFDGDLTFTGDDFEFIRQFDTLTRFICFIKPLRQIGTQNKTIVTYFRYVDITFNLDNKSATTKVFYDDAYTKLLANLNQSYDLLKLKVAESKVTYDVSDTVQIAATGYPKLFNSYRREVKESDTDPMDVGEIANKGFNVENVLTSVAVYGKDGTFLPGDGPNGYRMGTSWANSRFRPPSKNTYDEKIKVGNLPVIDPDDFTNDTYEVYITKMVLTSLTPRTTASGERTWVEIWANYIPFFRLNQTHDIVRNVTTYSIRVVNRKANGTVTTAIIAGDLLKPIQYDHRAFEYAKLVAGAIAKVSSTLNIGGKNVTVSVADFYYTQLGVRRLTSQGSGGFPIDPEKDSFCRSFLYKRAEPLSLSDIFVVSSNFSYQPTDYGAVKDSIELIGTTARPLYYQAPTGNSKYIPFLRDDWDSFKSLWIDAGVLYQSYPSNRNTVSNYQSFEVGEVIKALLKKIDDSLHFESTAEYSQFLYGEGPYRLKAFGRPDPMRLYITQRSNVNKPNADEYAMKAPVSLNDILNMLTEAFNLYWFIEGNKLRIEQVQWFIQGGTYATDPSELAKSINLALFKDSRLQRRLSLGTGSYSFDLSNDYSRRKLSWSPDESAPFTEGSIVLNDSYDIDEKSRDVELSKFTADIEYCAAYGKDLPNDGLAIMGVVIQSNGVAKVVPATIEDENGSHEVQNGNLSLYVLFSTWLRDNLPCLTTYKYNNLVNMNAGVKMYAAKSKAVVPQGLNISDIYVKIKTPVGVGHIVRMSENLDTGTIEFDLAYERLKNS